MSARARVSIEAGQAACIVAAAVGVFLLLPLGWALVVVGVVGSLLLTGLERAARPALDPSETPRVEPEPETDGA